MKIFNRALSIEEIAAEKDKVDLPIYGQLLYVSKSTFFTEGLIHYWPMTGSTNDIVGGKHIIIKENGHFIKDRFNNKESGT